MVDDHGSVFSIGAFELDDRLRLFNFAAADKRVDYLWVLRAFEHARANYVVLLHASEVAANLTELTAEHPEMPSVSGELTPLLDQLHGWHVLERSYDGARAATLSEYRNRHYVYQFSQAGYGKSAKPGAPARVERNDAGRRRLRERQLAERQAMTAAAAESLAAGVDGRVLDDTETDLLLGLLDLALAARVAVSGAVGGSGSAYGVRLTLRPHPVSTVVRTVREILHLDRLALVVTPR
ncbi:DUF2397 family protein [Actinocrispum wychmicini]|uniref:Uncharacterized protein DUF2397 n=1 Tax=Actinocrispum wychmicini TaxID=1213861 RepID=A0A4R2JZX6_9PSEU|nr:DUF2397 family protein [Actinocrispum wychmicini]TCO63006.1 uncharacterized protein DUF2397 [Actinocrispum wychmicini]